MSDKELLQGYIRTRSEEAFSGIVERHLAFVYRVCLREVCDQQIAEDAALAVFLLLSQKAHTIRSGEQLGSWLFTAARLTARNAALQERRRQAREREAVAMAQNVEPVWPKESDAGFVDTHLNDALGCLSQREREAVLLRFQDDLEVAQVGKALGISESAAQMRLSRGLAKMRRIFARKGLGLSVAAIGSALIAVKSEAAPAGLAAKATAIAAANAAIAVSPAATILYKGALKTMWIAKVKTVAALSASLLVCAGATTLAVHLLAAPSVPVVTGTNAFDYYARAGQLVNGIDAGASGLETIPASEYPAIIARNKASLTLLRQGFAYGYTNPEITSISAKMPYLMNFRKLGQLLVIESHEHASTGDWSGAATSGIDAIRFGTDVPHGGVLINALVGRAICAMGRGAVWQCIPYLSSKQALGLENRLDSTESTVAPFSSILKTEAGTVTHWPDSIESSQMSEGAPSVPAHRIPITPADRQAYADWIAEWAQMAAMPYSSSAVLPQAPPLDDPFMKEVMTPPVDMLMIWTRLTTEKTRTAELETALALQAFRSDSGQYPSSLGELVANNYMPSLPEDPYAASSPLHYRKLGAAYLLYSVGPDGVDDGGEPIVNGSNGIDGDSKGDLVAGQGANPY